VLAQIGLAIYQDFVDPSSQARASLCESMFRSLRRCITESQSATSSDAMQTDTEETAGGLRTTPGMATDAIRMLDLGVFRRCGRIARECVFGMSAQGMVSRAGLKSHGGGNPFDALAWAFLHACGADEILGFVRECIQDLETCGFADPLVSDRRSFFRRCFFF
jgi:hypothetical protein